MVLDILRKIYSFFLDIIQTLLLAAAVFLVIYVFLFRPFQVNGNSMYPNFHDKEYVITNIIGLHFEDVKLGDVIVFKSPANPDRDFIKRVIGIPGDTILIKSGNVYINGKLLGKPDPIMLYVDPEVTVTIARQPSIAMVAPAPIISKKRLLETLSTLGICVSCFCKNIATILFVCQ